jgi:hypothetical protein
MTPLIPPDPARCQAEIREGSFMTLGPRAFVRCTATPTVIVTEAVAGEDGQRGSMSLCDACLAMLKQQGLRVEVRKIRAARKGER